MTNKPSFGITLGSREELDSISADDLRQMIFDHGWLLVRDAHYDSDDFEQLAARLGSHIEYGFGKVLNMEAKQEAEESQFTNASMPLHQDAILNAENDAQFLVFRCLETVVGVGGETLLTDNRKFIAKAPEDLITTLREIRFSYTPMAKGYYKRADGQNEILLSPLARHPETGEETLQLALDDPADDRRNYAARVAGFDEEASRALMTRVDAVLRDPEILHAHEWRVGDLLILDNFLVCHGRNPSRTGTRRRLQRIAIKARKQSVAA